MTPDERIAKLEAQVAELLQRFNSAPSLAGAGSHLAVDRASFNSLLVTDSDSPGTTDPSGPFHVVAQHKVGLLESTEAEAWLVLQTKEGFDKRVAIANRSGGRLSFYNPDKGDVFNITSNGNSVLAQRNQQKSYMSMVPSRQW